MAQLSPEFGRLGPSNASLFAYDFGQAIHPEDTTGQCPHCLSFPDLLVINVTYMLMHLASDQVKDPEKIQLRGVFGLHRFPSGHGRPPVAAHVLPQCALPILSGCGQTTPHFNHKLSLELLTASRIAQGVARQIVPPAETTLRYAAHCRRDRGKNTALVAKHRLRRSVMLRPWKRRVIWTARRSPGRQSCVARRRRDTFLTRLRRALRGTFTGSNGVAV